MEALRSADMEDPMPGPVPKRASQRRRRNEPDVPTDKAEASGEFVLPRANSKWHPVAKAWFNSLAGSGQSQFYEPSDWALATLIGESMSRDLKPQFVGITEAGAIVKEALPMKGASLAAYLKAMTALLTTEGDRRRLRLELEKPGAPAEREDPKVKRMSEYRGRFTG